MSEALIGRIPDHWETLSLGEVCARGGGDIQTGPFGSQLHASDYVPVGIPSVMPQNIGHNVIIEEDIARISPADARRLKRYLLAPGDIVYSRRGDVERRALVRPEQSGWLCGTGCLRIRPGTGADSRFLSYYLGHREVRAYIVRHAIGATMPNLNTQILSAVPIVLPPRPVQQAIGAMLGALDDKIAVNERVAAAIEGLAAAELSRLLSEFDPTAGWGLVRLGAIASINELAVRPKSSGHLRYIDISSVARGRIAWPDLISWDEAPSRARRGVSFGDTIWSTVRPGRRSYALILEHDPDLVASTGFAVITPTRIGPAYLYSVVTRDEFVNYLESVAEGSAYPAVGAERFADVLVPLPPESLLNDFEAEVMPLRSRAHAAERETLVLAKLRDALLPKLISGELRIRDAEKVVEEAV